MPRALTFVLLAALVAVLALAGCASVDEEAVKEDELPVACVTKPKPGKCGKSIPKAYFDYRTNHCRTFYWSGCGGQVPYQTMAECKKQCEPKPKP
jgi:hypothetical protein